MPDPGAPRNPREAVLVEQIPDQTPPSVGVETTSIRGADTCAFLPSVLETVQTEVDQLGGFVVPEDPNDAAFLAELAQTSAPKMRE